MKNIRILKGLSEIIDQYNIFILDQWGVMHNGQKGFDYAVQCVEKIYQRKHNIIIISNSSKRKDSSLNKLVELGFDSKHFFEVMTSGEMIWQSLFNQNYDFTKNLKKNCYHIYNTLKEDEKYFVQGLEKFNFVKKIEDADFILGCTSLPGLDTIDYVPILTQALKKQIPFICANPDYETIENNSNICMGTISELYKSLGGEIFMLGKPSLEIYIESTKKIQQLDKSKVLAVGDSMFHDIKGANLFGVDSLFITSGVHHSSFNNDGYQKKLTINQFKNLGIIPTFLCSKFQF